jgi:hypothetical protein
MDKIIKLNIGGFRYETTLYTLDKYPDSMLSSMFSGRHKLTTTDDGYHFIDRNGEYFTYILKFLRDGNINLDVLSYKDINNILDEANYFNLDKLVEYIEDDPHYQRKKLNDFDTWYCVGNDTHWKLQTDNSECMYTPPKFIRHYTFLPSQLLSTEIYTGSTQNESQNKVLIIFKMSNNNIHFYTVDITDAVKKLNEEYLKMSKELYKSLLASKQTIQTQEQEDEQDEQDEQDDEIQAEVDSIMDKKYCYFGYEYVEEIIDLLSHESNQYKFLERLSDKYFVKLFELNGYVEIKYIRSKCDNLKIYYNPDKGDEILKISHEYDSYINKIKYEKDDCDINGKYYRPIVLYDDWSYYYVGYKYIYVHYYNGLKKYLISDFLQKDFVNYVYDHYPGGKHDSYYSTIKKYLGKNRTLDTIVGDYDYQYYIFSNLAEHHLGCYYGTDTMCLVNCYDKYIVSSGNK